MDFRTIRQNIRRKLETGGLPLEKARGARGRTAAGEACDGCDMTIAAGQLAIALGPGRGAAQLHLRCLEIWTQERSSLLREREGMSAFRFSLDERRA